MLSRKHKGCFDAIIPLAEAAKNAKHRLLLADLEHTINITIGNIQECVKERKAATERMEMQEIRIRKFISITRQNINKHLDDLERKLLNDLSATYSSCRSKYLKLTNKLNTIEKAIKRFKEETSDLKRFAPDLHVFLSTHQMNKEVHDDVKALQEAISSIDNYSIEIEIHQGITSLLEDVDCFAKIKVDKSTISFPFKDAKIDQAQLPAQNRRSVHNTRLQLRRRSRLKQKGTEMYISGCTILSNGNLLIADNKGKNALLEYDDDGKFIRDIPVSARPYNIALIDTDRIAVSYSVQRYIDIIDLNEIIVVKSMKFKNNCRDISYSDEKIYVGGEGIEVLDMEGTIVNSMKCDNTDVFNITTSKSRIYYTKFMEKTVYCCSSTGEEIWSFKDKSLSFPGGIAVDPDQNVFVVDINSSNLLILQDGGKVSKTLLTKADGLLHPTRVIYNKEESLLLVCNSKNSVLLFSVN
ncbi:unnamed protein product [Mytilus edulis]|uniref:Uncharacterized protein n=1 Tax=Mytilus edulis TaxID=6550 RepID=A0A8S3RG33_MYTED|nr:unnamed protein product [Mytilus edulis]